MYPSEIQQAAKKLRDELIAPYENIADITPKDYSLLELLHVDVLQERESLDDWAKRVIGRKTYGYHGHYNGGYY